MNDRSGDGTGSFEVKIRTNTAKSTNRIIARLRESRYLVRESEVFIKDKTKVANLRAVSWYSFWPVVVGGHRPIRRNSVLEELRVKRLLSGQFKSSIRHQQGRLL